MSCLLIDDSNGLEKQELKTNSPNIIEKMGESKLLLALFCNKILTKSEQGVVVVVISWRSGCVTLTVTLQLYRGGECVILDAFAVCGILTNFPFFHP